MKKAAIVIMLAIAVSLCLFAAETGSIQFKIRWYHVIGGSATLSILEYDGENELANKEKALESTDEIQNVAMLRYSSNIGGIHTLKFKATALKFSSTTSQTQGTTSCVGYKLYIEYNGMTSMLPVGDDPETTYPAETESVQTTINVPLALSSPQVSDILIRAQLDEIDEMISEVPYTSTVTIERTIN